MTLQEYLALITSEHAQKQTFVSTVESSIEALAHMQSVLNHLPIDFDLDEATGVQLDAVGEWVGVIRRLAVPLQGVYFAFDAEPEVGWDGGDWKGQYDPDTTLTDLHDDAYRVLIKTRILANHWDGSIPQAYAIWQTLFSAKSFLIIQDNQDMSLQMSIAGEPLSLVEQALLVNGYIPIKPMGVRVNSHNVVPEPGKLFAWDIEPNDALDGWDAGLWAKELFVKLTEKDEHEQETAK